MISALDACEQWLMRSSAQDFGILIAKNEDAISEICAAYDEEETMYRDAFLSPLEFVTTVKVIRDKAYGSNGRIDIDFLERWIGYIEEYLDIMESVPDLVSRFKSDIWKQMQV